MKTLIVEYVGKKGYSEEKFVEEYLKDCDLIVELEGIHLFSTNYLTINSQKIKNKRHPYITGSCFDADTKTMYVIIGQKNSYC